MHMPVNETLNHASELCQELSARKMLVTWHGTGKDRTRFISSQDTLGSRSMEELSASEVPNLLTDVLPDETTVDVNCPQVSDSNNVSKPSTAIKVYPSRTHKPIDRFEPTWT